MSKKKFDSYEWSEFMNQFFDRTGYEMWHDGADPSVVLKLNAEELKEAENMLIESTKEDGMWPTLGLVLMKSKKVVPLLKEKLDSNSDIIRIRAADALEQIEDTGEFISILIDELFNAPSSYDRLEAAMILRKYPTERVVEALLNGMTDIDYLVRYHSSESVLKIYGLPPDISGHKEIFKYICSKSDKEEPIPEDYAKAVSLMKDVLKDKRFTDYLNKK